jgi:hypothetical protein
MLSVAFYSQILILVGFLMLFGAFIGLAYSKREERETIQIFQEHGFTLTSRFVQPFRMHQNGEINILLDAKVKNESEEQVPSFKAYLTDLYSNIELDYSYGPRYFEFNQLGSFEKIIDLKIGDYNIIFENSGESDILVKFGLILIYPDYPNRKYIDWALAFIDIGVSMLLVGLTLYLSTRI